MMNPLTDEHVLGKLASLARNENADEDIEALYYACELLIQQAAKLFACALSAVLLKSGCGLPPPHPSCIVIDGTTFYAVKNFKFPTEYYLTEILREENLRYYEVARVESALLRGRGGGTHCL